MKRYDCVSTGGIIVGHIPPTENTDGRFYLVSDVEREMIPKPDAEEVLTLVANLMERVALDIIANPTSAYSGATIEARNALLKLMGGEV